MSTDAADLEAVLALLQHGAKLLTGTCSLCDAGIGYVWADGLCFDGSCACARGPLRPLDEADLACFLAATPADQRRWA